MKIANSIVAGPQRRPHRTVVRLGHRFPRASDFIDFHRIRLHRAIIRLCVNVYGGKKPPQTHRMNNEIFNTFDAPTEQGSSEWKAFNAVTHDKTSLLHATNYRPQPRTPSAIRFGSSRLFVLKRA